MTAGACVNGGARVPGMASRPNAARLMSLEGGGR